jgi:ABC-2 type transport system ATP-binding protein
MASGSDSVVVVTPAADDLAAVVRSAGGRVTEINGDAVTVTDLSSAEIGELALRSRLVLHELTPQRASLEDTFVELTGELVDAGRAS